MKKEKRLPSKKMYQEYKDQKAFENTTKDLIKTIVDKFPNLENWNISLGDNKRILVCRHSSKNGNLTEFIEVVKGIEKITGKVADKEFEDFLGSGFEFLHGTIELDKGSIDIRMFGIDKCEIEYVEEIKKIPKLTGFCADAINN